MVNDRATFLNDDLKSHRENGLKEEGTEDRETNWGKC